MLQLYKNIKNKRMELNMTQSKLAELLGYADKSMIAKIEKGKIDLPQSKILAFARALHSTPAELMGWEETPTQDLPNIIETSEIDIKYVYGESEYLELSEEEKTELEKTIKNAILLKKMEFEEK